VPVDFEKQSLIEGLRASAYRTDAPAVFSWLGVTEYLTPEAIFNTLRTIASLAPGAEIIFQYDLPTELLDEEAQRVLAVVMAGAAARNEPLITFFEPARLAEQVRELGFSEVWNFSPEEASPLSFGGRTDGLRPRAYILWEREWVRDRADAAYLDQAKGNPRLIGVRYGHLDFPGYAKLRRRNGFRDSTLSTW
jgi:hypothetical protein